MESGDVSVKKVIDRLLLHFSTDVKYSARMVGMPIRSNLMISTSICGLILVVQANSTEPATGSYFPDRARLLVECGYSRQASQIWSGSSLPGGWARSNLRSVPWRTRREMKMLTSRLPLAVEFGRLRRLRETVLGGEPKRQSPIVATDDWIAEVDARLADLERAIMPPFRVSP